MAGQQAHTINVPQQDGTIGVTFPGRPKVELTVLGGQVKTTDPAVADAVLISVPGAHRPEDAPPDFDPAFHTVDEVTAYLDEHPDDAARVLDLERQERPDVPAAKQQRAGVLNGPHSTADDDPDAATEPTE